MNVLRDPLGRDEPHRGSVLSIGNFDGVHVGHQAVLRHVVDRARELRTVAAAMTLDPHPIKLLRPRQAPRLLSTLEQRLELMERTGIEMAIVLPFTHRLARMQAVDFVKDIIVERLGVREVYIGANFRFGADRGGDVDLLETMGSKLGFVAAGAPTVEIDGEVVSSTRVRQTVREGRVEEAERLLGRPLWVDGVVLEGRKLGRKLGFPTLNIESDNELHPGHGVYITVAHLPSFDRVFPSVTNIGVRPTVYEDSVTTIESHLLDFSADVYRERVRLFFLRRVREEKSFSSPTQLMAQIGRDVTASRDWFSDHPLGSLNLVLP